MNLQEAALAGPRKLEDAVTGGADHPREPSRRARLAFITQWFPPENEGLVPLWIAASMRDRGFDVGIITGVPHYPTGVVARGYRASRRMRERMHGFGVLRLPEYPSHDSSTLRRIATFGSFGASAALLATGIIGRADVSLVFSSPATAAIPAITARMRGGTPYVLYVQDLWPDSIFATGFLNGTWSSRVVESVVGKFTQLSYRSATHIAVITPGMKSALEDRGVPAEKLSVVYNWVDESVIRPAPSDGRLRNRIGAGAHELLILYAGNHGKAQGLDAWLRAMASLSDLTGVRLVLIGDGVAKLELQALAGELGLGDRAVFLDPIPVEHISAYTADANVSVVSLVDHPLFHVTMPGKTQAVLAQGKPIIVSAPGDAAELVRKAKAGWVAEPGDIESIAAAIRAAVRHGAEERANRGDNGRNYYQTHMSQEVGATRLFRLLEDAVDQRTGSIYMVLVAGIRTWTARARSRISRTLLAADEWPRSGGVSR